MSQSGDRDVLRIALVVLVLLGIPLLTGVLMMPMMGAHASGAAEIGFVLSLVVPLIIVLLVVVVGVRALADREGRDEALEELRQAYARGDISDEEFERRRERLRED